MSIDRRNSGTDRRRHRLPGFVLILMLGILSLGAGSKPEDEASTEPERTNTLDLDRDATIFVIPIEGMIDLGLAPFVERVVEEAANADNGVILLDINTFGGRVDAAVLIRDALIDAPVPTIALINPRAISAGALISLACETIAIVPGGTIGAATPITGGATEKPEAADEKFMSYMRTEMRATAERRGRSGDIAEAMVDRDMEIEGVSEKGKVLTLTSKLALSLEVADLDVKDLADTLEQLNITKFTIEERRLNWAEKIARAVSNPVITSFLLSIGFLGIIIELYQPGWGLPGTLGLICLLVFFFGHHVANLAGAEELLLFSLGILLLALEFLVIPGFGVVGIAGAGCVAIAVLLSLIGLDLKVAWDIGLVRNAVVIMASSLVITAGGVFLMIRLLPATGITRRLVLDSALTVEEGYSSHDSTASDELPLGSTGTVESDLRPAGRVRFGKRRVDAVSEGGFIQAGAPVTLVEWRAGTAVVRETA